MKNNPMFILDKLLSCAVIISFLLMIVVVIIQIIARYALPWSPHWTEEMARFSFIYMVSLGAGLAIKDRAYVSVTTFLHRLPPNARKFMDCFILISITLLMLFMFIYSIPLVRIVSLQKSAALQLNMSLMYISMSLMGLLVSIYSLIQLKERLKHNNIPT